MIITEHDLLQIANVRPSWDGFLERLAEMAAPEPWNKPGADPTDKPFVVLSNLVRHSFRRAVHVGAVAYGHSEAGDAFAFCPRVRTVGFEAIYLVARQSQNAAARPWSLDLITRGQEARRILGLAPKEQLPGPPSFWDDPADLVLDPEVLAKLDVDVEHLATNERLLQVFPAELQGDVLMRKFALEKAIEVAVERGCENPRIAAPVFSFDSPSTGSGRVRLCLPLHLRSITAEHRSADMALVIEPQYRADELIAYGPKTLLDVGDVYLQSRIFELPNQEVWPRP